jgi:hypothetical protein
MLPIGLGPPRTVPPGCWIGMELPGVICAVVWAVVVADAFSALNPKGRFGLGVTGVPIGAWVITGLPAGMVGM